MPHDDSELSPMRSWDWISRSQFEIDYRSDVVAVDVDFFDWNERISVFRNGQRIAHEKSPIEVPIDSQATVVAKMSMYGMRYVGLKVAGEAEPRHLRPAADTGEKWRADLKRDRPELSRLLDVAAWTLLVVGLITQLPIVINGIGNLIDFSVPTFNLPGWLNTVITVAGIAAALDRALQMKHNRWIDNWPGEFLGD